MADMGLGFGSECNLLRYLGRHRAELDARVDKLCGADSVSWLDFPYDPSNKMHDGEIQGLDFLPPDSPTREEWKSFWPQTGRPQCWDAIGKLQINGEEEWLLIEAKAHTEEIFSSCGASPRGGRPMIEASLDRVKSDLGAPAEADWLSTYYQFCNRIAVLWFLIQNKTPARLLFIYFTGDHFPDHNFECPQGPEEWLSALEEQDRHIGLPADHKLSDRVHKLFLPIRPL